MHSVTSNAVANKINSVSNLQECTALTFERGATLNQWQRTFEITTINNGQGFNAILTVMCHNTSHVENACFLINVSLGGMYIIQLNKGHPFSYTTIRTTCDTNYPSVVDIDILCTGYDIHQAYRVTLINLGGISNIQTHFEQGDYSAKAYVTTCTTTDNLNTY